MLKFFSSRLNNKGFTLIELIVVIAIIGILALIAVPRLTGFTDSAAVAADKASAATIGNAVMLHYANEGAPATATTIVINGATAGDDKIHEMIKDGNNNLPKPQVSAEKHGFAVVVDTDGSVKVYYANEASTADTDKQLWPASN